MYSEIEKTNTRDCEDDKKQIVFFEWVVYLGWWWSSCNDHKNPCMTYLRAQVIPSITMNVASVIPKKKMNDIIKFEQKL